MSAAALASAPAATVAKGWHGRSVDPAAARHRARTRARTAGAPHDVRHRRAGRRLRHRDGRCPTRGRRPRRARRICTGVHPRCGQQPTRRRRRHPRRRHRQPGEAHPHRAAEHRPGQRRHSPAHRRSERGRRLIRGVGGVRHVVRGARPQPGAPGLHRPRVGLRHPGHARWRGRLQRRRLRQQSFAGAPRRHAPRW